MEVRDSSSLSPTSARRQKHPVLPVGTLRERLRPGGCATRSAAILDIPYQESPERAPCLGQSPRPQRSRPRERSSRRRLLRKELFTGASSTAPRTGRSRQPMSPRPGPDPQTLRQLSQSRLPAAHPSNWANPAVWASTACSGRWTPATWVWYSRRKTPACRGLRRSNGQADLARPHLQIASNLGKTFST